jgi:hypothetical protein
MPGCVFLKVLSRLSSKKFDDLIGQPRNMVLEFLIVNLVDQRRLLRVMANFVSPPSEDLAP